MGRAEFGHGLVLALAIETVRVSYAEEEGRSLKRVLGTVDSTVGTAPDMAPYVPVPCPYTRQWNHCRTGMVYSLTV